jgi:hypothetical protein
MCLSDRCEGSICSAKEKGIEKKAENAAKYVDGKGTEKDKMDSSALKQMHAGVSIVNM